jgi:hypothetical protein
MNHFCNKDTVRDMIEGKTIALVGSAPSVLNNEIGFIDSHDVVIRVSNYKLFKPTGARTDIHYSFFGNSIKKTKEELIEDGVKLCMCKCPNDKFMESAWHRRHGKLNGVDFRYIYEARKQWWFCDTYIPTTEEFLENFRLLNDHVPTTGFSAVLDVLKYQPKSIYMTGFDFFTTPIHNVNERWKRMNPSDPIGHVPDAETLWLTKNIDNLPIIMDKRLKTVIKARA